MDYAQVVRRRRMTRRFRADAPVDPQLVCRLLADAGRAPSAGFSQGWAYVALLTDADRDRFWAAATPTPAHPPALAAAPTPAREATSSAARAQGSDRAAWLAGVRAAPVLILAVADEGAYRRRYAEPDKGATEPADQDWPIPYWLTDTAMGVLLILLGATDTGLGALFFGVPGARHTAVKDAFGVPADRALVGVIALGHEERRVGGSARHRPRRGLEDYVHWGRFGAPATDPAASVGENAAQEGPSPAAQPG